MKTCERCGLVRGDGAPVCAFCRALLGSEAVGGLPPDATEPERCGCEESVALRREVARLISEMVAAVDAVAAQTPGPVVSRRLYEESEKQREQAEGALALSRVGERNARNELAEMVARVRALKEALG